MYSHTQKIAIQKNVSVFSIHTKKYYVIHAKKLLVFFTIQKITMYYTHTKKYYIIHHTKKLLCSAHAKKLPYIFYYVFFPIQKITMYYTQKKSHTKKMLVFFPYKKLLCITRKKNHIQKKC